MSDAHNWQQVRYMTDRQKQRRLSEMRDASPTPGEPSRLGWIAVEAEDRIVAYPALFIPRPTMDDICTAYSEHPQRGKQK